MNIVVVIDGGIIQEVLGDFENVKTNVVIVDRDVQDTNEEEIRTIEGEESYVYAGITEVNQVPQRVNKVFDEAQRQPIKTKNTDFKTEMINETLETYLRDQSVKLSDEQKKRAFDGVQFWLQNALDEAISDSVQSVL